MPSPRPLPVAEAALATRMAQEGLRPTRWSNGPRAACGMHDHPYGKVLIVVEGSITFVFDAGGRRVPMRAGDRLSIPPHTPHSAVVGQDGVVCLEAHLSPGRPN